MEIMTWNTGLTEGKDYPIVKEIYKVIGIIESNRKSNIFITVV